MDVPITSDLHGYAAFWSRVVLWLAVGFGVFGVSVITLLVLIYRKLP